MPGEEAGETTRKAWFIFSLLLIAGGIAFYWSWGILYGTWNLLSREGLGAYVITVLLVGFGIVGAFLHRRRG